MYGTGKEKLFFDVRVERVNTGEDFGLEDDLSQDQLTAEHFIPLLVIQEKKLQNLSTSRP